jgi:hypothetical protein
VAGPAGDHPGGPQRAAADDDTATLQREVAAALKHDLGKYVAWRSANLDEAAWTGPLGELAAASIRDDVMATSRTADGTLAAWDVFGRLVARWPGALPPELEATAAALAELRALEPALRTDDRDAIARARPIVRAAQSTIRQQLAGLCRRLANRS